MAKRISILGSTGSIGVNTLAVIDQLDEDLEVVYLSAYKNTEKIIEQAKKYRPQAIVVINDSSAAEVKNGLVGESIDVLIGRKGLLEISQRDDVDLLMNGLVGSAGMEPTLNAVKAGVDVALSNKESLVMAGDIINRTKEKTGVSIYPVDSEHSAIWQCLTGERLEEVRRIILTGSGGPFRTRDLKTFPDITVNEALNHPNWNMGKKITIDSATMMNKGLEVIEAHWLFNFSADQIDIVVHPQSIIHSMVEFKDSSVKAQLGVPDMKVPIQYALTYPQHVTASWDKLDLTQVGQLTFDEKDLDRFPCIGLGYEALRSGGTTPAVLNVANDNAVYNFLEERIKFTDIPRLIEETCAAHDWIEHPNLEELLKLELWAAKFVRNAVEA
jgi:1-deoxy-D-xylulose-5-phosphate reductoisomerase